MSNKFPKPNKVKYEKSEWVTLLKKLITPWTSKIQENILKELQKNLIIPEWEDNIIDLNFPWVVSIKLIDQVKWIDFIYFSPQFYIELEKLKVNKQTKLLKSEIKKSWILERKENILKINNHWDYSYYSSQKFEIYNKISLLNEETEFIKTEIKYFISIIRKFEKVREYFLNVIHFYPNNFPATQAKHLIEFLSHYEDENKNIKEIIKLLEDFLYNKKYLSISMWTKNIKNPEEIIEECWYLLYHKISERIENLKTDLQNFYYNSSTLK